MTPKHTVGASIEEIYNSKEANRMNLFNSIAATNKKLQKKQNLGINKEKPDAVVDN